MRCLGFCAFLVLAPWASAQTEWPQTKAEQTNYQKTSSYDDVMAFLDGLQKKKAPIVVKIIGKSPAGKPIPLVICHRNPRISPQEAAKKSLPIVYIQANIHAGEVEGKEAILAILRELAQNPKDSLLDKLVLLITPIYNIDGNDKWGTNEANRGHQDGPDPIGERANGQGFDLNRDHIKAESNECRAILEHVYRAWNPQVMMDLHTTNGTRHGYTLTYMAGMNPTTDSAITQFTRDELLPGIGRKMESLYGMKTFDYGDVETRDGKMIFATTAVEPRYSTTYAGVRNCIGILSEAASFLPFKTRVEATHHFVRLTLDQLANQRTRVLAITRAAAEKPRTWMQDESQIGIRFDYDSRGTEKFILEVDRPAAEINHMKAPTQFRTVEIPIWDRYKATRTAAFPVAYMLPPDALPIAELLKRHGIEVQTTQAAMKVSLDAFTVETPTIARNPFQGHRLVQLDGKFTKKEIDLPAGSFIVSASQPLGLLAFHMLEPESADGVVAWGFFGEEWKAGDQVKIYKLFNAK